jgi:tetratricopeptide (TPR) repeat protein
MEWSRNFVKSSGLIIVLSLLSLWWWSYAASGNSEKHILLIAVSLGSLMIGCLIGFLFSSFGEELNTIGKIRDWVIGGLTGLTIAEMIDKGGVFKTLLLKFAVPPTDREFALVIAMAVIYFSAGFFSMFFQRELILNLLLAKSRAQRGKLEGTPGAVHAIQKSLSQLPASVLSGVDNIDETRVGNKEKEDLKNLLFSDDVKTFLAQAEEAVRNNEVLDWDTITKAAHLEYYRTYFVKEGQQRRMQARKAHEWITRALALNPLHTDLTMKLADMLWFDDQVDAAVAVVEHLIIRPDAPAIAYEWLGYFLRSIPSRVDDSIKYSKQYLALFPNDENAPFNLAYALGVKYCMELKLSGKPSEPTSANRAEALKLLTAGLTQFPDFKTTVGGKWVSEKKGFECLAQDEDFKKLVAVQPAPAK